MPGAVRIGDLCSGHDDCRPQSLISASPNVNINGRGAGRTGDRFAVHGCLDHEMHKDFISGGSTTVRINGLNAGRAGDPVNKEGYVSSGSNNVFIG